MYNICNFYMIHLNVSHIYNNFAFDNYHDLKNYMATLEEIVLKIILNRN